MNKTVKLLLGGSAVALVGYQLYGFYNVGKNIAYNVTVWGFDKNPLNMTMILNVELINPTLQTVVIKSVSGNLLYKGAEVAQVNYLQSITLKAKTRQEVHIPVKFKLLNIISVLIQGKNKLAIDFNITFFTSIGQHKESGTFAV